MTTVNELLEMRDEIERKTKGKVVSCKSETSDSITFEVKISKSLLLKPKRP